MATASPAHPSPSPSPVPAPPSPVPAPPSPRTESSVPLRTLVPGTVRAGVEVVGGRTTVQVRSVSGHHRGALTRADGDTIAEAARVALDDRLPLVMVLSSSGSEVSEGIDALHGWGRAAAAVAACSGAVPVLAAVTGAAISGPSLLLGLADVTVMTPDAFAFVSGPDAVAGFTGMRVSLHDLGGAAVHASASGLCALLAADEGVVDELLGSVLDYLPDHTDAEPPRLASDDPADRRSPQLRDLVPAAASASYDVRDVVRAIVDDGELLELRPRWAAQLVTALASVGGRPVGVVANQPRSLAGTLDIPASQKGARFVRFCDSFNLPIVTLVDTPGFLPGKDLEWRGMIRHGAELAFAYAEATVPRVCVVLRKAYGGAYIVMDSKGIGNDLCLAWPSAEIAVMGAQGAVQILNRNAGDDERRHLEQRYDAELLTPWVAAERGFVDEVVDPAETRPALHRALGVLASRRELLRGRKHDAGPM
ncbi:MAG TPA: carboxyl transferase domain-containing protein [Acidimicrobiales bacterium]|nr:carboxyl transferase domain-containing protein [Acidimicrobiales bacterium]